MITKTQQVYDSFSGNKPYTIAEIEKLSGLSNKEIHSRLFHLVNQGKIKRLNSGRNAKYVRDGLINPDKKTREQILDELLLQLDQIKSQIVDFYNLESFVEYGVVNNITVYRKLNDEN